MKSAVKDGIVINEEDAVIPVYTRETECAFSVYESLSVKNGMAEDLPEHLERLSASCSETELNHPFSKEDISHSIESLISADKIDSCSLRIFLIGGKEPHYFITYTDLPRYPDSYYSQGVPVIIFSGERYLPKAKTGSMIMQYIALRDAGRRGAFEALLTDRNGNITEGTRTNVYALSGRNLMTAPNERVLSGITRKRILEIASSVGLGVVYECPKKSDIYSFDGIFISSTSMGIIPVGSVDGREIKVTENLAREINAKLRRKE